MASTERIVFAGVATSVLLIGAGFGSGILLGKAAVDVPQKVMQTARESVPAPDRVILPVTTAAIAPLTAVPPVQAAATTPIAPQAKPEPAPEFIPVKDVHVQQDIEKGKQAARQAEAEKQQAAKKAAERERHKRYAAQKARQEAARKQQEQQQQLQQQQEALRQSERPRVLAFDREDGPPQQVGFFGN